MRNTSFSLLDRLKTDAGAPDWRRFTEVYEPLMRGWLRRRNLPEQDVDDLVQNVLAVVVRRLQDFDHNGRVGAFRTWLRGITARCLQEHWRSNRQQAGAAGGSDMQELIAQLEDPASELSCQWDDEHDRHVVRRLLELLRDEFEPRTWAAFQRFVVDGIPAADVARELGVTPNVVWIAKSRVLARLKQESAGMLDE